SSLPTSVEPVNVTLRTSGFSIISPTICEDDPVTMLTTPFGKPASLTSSINLSAVKGLSREGLTTTVQPAASAGALLRVIMASVQFHGVIAPTTPTGFFHTCIRLFVRCEGIVSP